MRPQPSHILFLVIGVIYFSFNSFLLPEGLLYTTLLTPFFLVNLLQRKEAGIYTGFFFLTFVLGIIQYTYTGHLMAYLKSFILLQCAAIFVINTYAVINRDVDLQRLFKVLGSFNLILIGISVVFLFIPGMQHWMWWELAISEGIDAFPRLKMFTYEASYYSLLVVPVFCYYFLRKVLLNGNWGLAFVGFTLGLMLSFSMGVLGGLLLSIFLLYAFNLNELRKTINLNYIGLSVVALLAITVVAFKFYPDNVLFHRIRNVSNGRDTSARGRTFDSFEIAWNLAKMNSRWFGIGLGQLKLIGRNYIIQYYSYNNMVGDVRIPNAVAETLNIYGIAGIILRFATIIYLFIKTEVRQNYYRLLLFIFVFIYQFTGSFLFNIVEYMIWLLAFSPSVFPQFNRQHFIKEKAYESAIYK